LFRRFAVWGPFTCGDELGNTYYTSNSGYLPNPVSQGALAEWLTRCPANPEREVRHFLRERVFESLRRRSLPFFFGFFLF
jgi:hypothetical protein